MKKKQLNNNEASWCTGFSKKSSDDPVRLVPLAIYFCTSHGPAGQTFHKHKATPPSNGRKKKSYIRGNKRVWIN